MFYATHRNTAAQNNPAPNGVSKAQFILSNIEKLPAKDHTFAMSMAGGVVRYKRASEKQLFWLDKLIARINGEDKPAERVKTAVGDLTGINALFDKAKASLKRPAIVLNAGEVEIRLSVAGPEARVPGSINVSTTGAFENRTWFGRILASGEFEASPRANAPAELIPTLVRFAAEPAATAAEYGRKTGSCCFCARELTDARSVAVGYGPVCSERFGLPWGDIRAEAA